MKHNLFTCKQVRRKELKLKRSFGHPGSRKSQCPAEKVLAKACLHHNLNGRKGKKGKKNKNNKGARMGESMKTMPGEIPLSISAKYSLLL